MGTYRKYISLDISNMKKYYFIHTYIGDNLRENLLKCCNLKKL